MAMVQGPGAGRRQFYRSIEHIKRANKAWADADENRAWFFGAEDRDFWNTRVLNDVYGGRYFVASNKPDIMGDGPRRYQVYRVDDDGQIVTVDRPEWHPDTSEWPGYETPDAAKQAAQVAASEEQKEKK